MLAEVDRSYVPRAGVAAVRPGLGETLKFQIDCSDTALLDMYAIALHWDWESEHN